MPLQSFRFGVQVGEVMTGAQLQACARMAEDLGYNVFSCSDHLHQSAPQLAPMVALSMVAAVTSTIELQPLVLAADMRHPALLAKETATLDLLSQGRFSLGLGAGWLAPDFQAAGRAFRRPGVRIQRLAEAIAVIRGLHGGDSFDFAGRHFHIDGLAGTPLPTRSPLPLLVAGSGRKLLSLAATTADTVALNPGLPFGAGSWQSGPTPYADITDTKLEWIRAAAGSRFAGLEIQTSVFAAGITDGDPAPLLAPLGALLGVPAEQLAGSPHVLVGTVDECVATVRRWRERWGISYISFPVSVAREMAPVVRALCGH